MNNLNKQLNFLLELDHLKAIHRQALVKVDKNRQENSAEHSWHVAMLAVILHEYAVEEVNVTRVMTMLLIHDIVEIDAGDMFAFAEPENLAAQEQKELDAANRIFGLLPEEQFEHFKALWLEFEQAESADARFAKAMDRILPLIQNMKNDGGSWSKHKVSKSKVVKRNSYLVGLAPELNDYALAQIETAVSNGWLVDD